MEPHHGDPTPDEERHEPRVRDDLDPEQGTPVADDELDESPAAGVDPGRQDPPEPSEPA